MTTTIIGHTKSKKPIYAPSARLIAHTKRWTAFDNSDDFTPSQYHRRRAVYAAALQAHIDQYSGFTKKDHKDAVKVHELRSGKLRYRISELEIAHDNVATAHHYAMFNIKVA